MPLKKISVFEDAPILEAHKIMSKEKLDLLPVTDRQEPTKIKGVLTSAGIANAIEKAKNR
jgi:CBS domain-containing protein